MGKKILTVLLTILLVFSTSRAVKAAELNSDGATAEVPVKYTVDNTEYIIRIPAELAPDTKDTQFIITADRMNLRPDEEVVVKIISGCDESGNIILKRQQDNTDNAAALTTALSVNGKNVAENDFIVGRFRDSDNSTENIEGYVNMSALDINEDTKAGDYVAVVEFQVELRRDADE